MAILETQAFIQNVKKTNNDNYFVTFSYLTGRTVGGKKSTQYISCLATKKLKDCIADIHDSIELKDGKQMHKYSSTMLSIKIRDPHFYIYEGDMKASLQSNGLLLSFEPFDPLK